MRSLGLDVGDRRIGVAMSDPSGIVASPLTIIERKNDIADIEAVADIIRRNGIGHIVIGLPLAVDGGAGMQAEKVKAFAKKLLEVVKVPADFRDESFTTVSARKLMMETMSKKARRRVNTSWMSSAVSSPGEVIIVRPASGCL